MATVHEDQLHDDRSAALTALGLSREWPPELQLQEGQPPPRPKGLLNTRNECFNRVVLQLLAHVPIFYEWLKLHLEDCENQTPEMCLACALGSFVTDYWSDPLSAQQVTAPIHERMRIKKRKELAAIFTITLKPEFPCTQGECTARNPGPLEDNLMVHTELTYLEFGQHVKDLIRKKLRIYPEVERGCNGCGVRSYKPEITSIIAAPEALFIKLDPRDEKLHTHWANTRYSLWLDLTKYRKRGFRSQRLRYRLSSVVFHGNGTILQKDVFALKTQIEEGIKRSEPGVRRPANIPLHTLSSSSRVYDTDPVSPIGSVDEKRDSQRSSLSEEFSEEWSDTGDLVDQLAEEEDPLRIRLRASLEEGLPRNGNRRSHRPKRVHYSADVEDRAEKCSGVAKRKEDIPIPNPPPRKISFGERLLVSIMAPNDGPSRIHGLHGKKLIYFTTIFVSLGVFLFGYDQGVMSGIITGPHFKDYFHEPSRAEIGTMVAILEVGAFISSLLVGKLGDRLGRRRTILYGSVIFVIGGALQSFANGMPMMMLGRITAGLGVGALSTIVPVYQSEISPAHNRGKLACIEFTGNIFGYAASVWVDYFCSLIDGHWAWRLPLLMQVLMGTLLGLGSFLILESPRWLLDNDHDEEGIVVIANLYGKGDIHNPKAREEYREIKMNVLLQRQEGERSYGDMFKRYQRRVFIAMSAQALAQLNGINVISYYAPLVFEQAGWVGRDAILMTGINGITYLLSTIPPWYLVDLWGRRLILLSGAVAMMIALSLISYFIYVDIRATPTLVVVFVMVYNAAFGASWGPIPWLYPPEILPLSIRAKGASLSTATNWAFNWLVGELTPVLQEWIQWRLYLVHAFFCALSFVIVWFLYPETANVRLEDMNSLFGDATSVVPTPETLAEVESLFSGHRSPVPSLDLRRQGISADNAIPGLDINPPVNQNGPPSTRGSLRDRAGSQAEGFGGWISSMVRRTRDSDGNSQGGGQYKRVEQEDEG
ncbi:hypothetical protein EJ06DRAFT_559327 [Trichodelitschia bisporula]|uniref:Major facilitator superfamily (MFS) profile domain-containing protein n=1 Tax=Trichodelitschia bisporula TaxID=703511 RepID=A0A6G1HMJ3_9PEZI|nr:hypothetical protein EJ06DRAFT_559327 [Trichodelitschia bisporula]